MLARQNSKTLTCFEASLHGLKKRGGGGQMGVQLPPSPICKQNARMMGFKKDLYAAK